MQNFKKYLDAQISEIRKHRWIESEKAGFDVGQDCCVDWISKFGKKFRYEWESRFNKNN